MPLSYNHTRTHAHTHTHTHTAIQEYLHGSIDPVNHHGMPYGTSALLGSFKATVIGSEPDGKTAYVIKRQDDKAVVQVNRVAIGDDGTLSFSVDPDEFPLLSPPTLNGTFECHLSPQAEEDVVYVRCLETEWNARCLEPSGMKRK